VIVAPPAPTANAPSAAPTVAPTPDDATIESKVSKALTNDPELGAANITVTVINGSATLIGSVKTPDLKARAERLAHAVKGVKSVDNKITVEGTPE
jgi:osmotically-inducible protein OsmY